MTQDRTPQVSRELLEYLTRLYPDRCPKLTDSGREVWAAAGRAEVVRKLRLLHEGQSRNAL